MSTHFKRILYGGDYNPNQWTKDIWQEDMRIFKDAHINTATINVFSWAKIQPSEHEYNFDELDEIVDMLSKENYDIVFATSTAALPGWMVRKYPEVMFTDYEGRQHKFGGRHNACPNSFVFKHYARAGHAGRPTGPSAAGRRAARAGRAPQAIAARLCR